MGEFRPKSRVLGPGREEIVPTVSVVLRLHTESLS